MCWWNYWNVLLECVAGITIIIVVVVMITDCRINGPYKDAQNRLLWRDKTCT